MIAITNAYVSRLFRLSAFPHQAARLEIGEEIPKVSFAGRRVDLVFFHHVVTK